LVSISGLEPLLTQDGSTPTFDTIALPANSRFQRPDMRTTVVGVGIPNQALQWLDDEEVLLVDVNERQRSGLEMRMQTRRCQ